MNNSSTGSITACFVPCTPPPPVATMKHTRSTKYPRSIIYGVLTAYWSIHIIYRAAPTSTRVSLRWSWSRPSRIFGGDPLLVPLFLRVFVRVPLENPWGVCLIQQYILLQDTGRALAFFHRNAHVHPCNATYGSTSKSVHTYDTVRYASFFL